MRKQLGILILLLIVSFFTACTSGPELPPLRVTLADVEPPAWVLKGGGAFEDQDEKVFYGVGSVSGVKNFSLQVMASDDRARNDLAKVFEVYTKSLTKDYMAGTTAGNFEVSSEEQNIEVALKTLTSSTLHGVMIVERWEHPRQNVMFSLARLDLVAFKNNLDRYQELSKALRDEIKERADTLHSELEKRS